MKFGKLIIGLLILCVVGVVFTFIYLKLSPKNTITVKEDHYALTFPVGWVQYDTRSENYDDIHTSRVIFISKKVKSFRYARPDVDILEMVTTKKFIDSTQKPISEDAYFSDLEKKYSSGQKLTLGGYPAFTSKPNPVENPMMEITIKGKNIIYRARFYAKDITTPARQEYFTNILSKISFL